MRSIHQNSNGFETIGAALVIAATVLMGFGGAYVWHNNHSKKPGAKSSQTDTSSMAKTTTKPPASDPYAGWKSYCDTSSKYCFRYPSDWSLVSNTGQVTVVDSSKDAEVDYLNPYAHDSGVLSFTPASVTDFTIAGSKLKIVGGVYTPANEPDYGIVDSSLVTTYPLTVGQPTNFPNALRFTDPYSSGNSIAFRARATSQMSSEAAAQAWFNTATGKTSLQILQSLYYQQ